MIRKIPTETTTDRSITDDKRKRVYEEGDAGIQIGLKDDPLTEYREKEAVAPAKIKEHVATTVKSDQNDQKMVELGEEG